MVEDAAVQSPGPGAEDGDVVQVEYECPVSAFVNVRTGEVERVVVWDEDIRPYPDRNGPSDVVKADYSGGVSEATAKKAREIAESEGWPAWGFGL